MSREPRTRSGAAGRAGTTLEAPVLPAAPRLAARARAQRRARLRRAGGWLRRSVVLLAGVAALAWVLLVSGWLSVDRVEVVGTSRLGVEQVREAAGVAPGTALAGVDTAGVRDRVAALAPVASVEVLRSGPGTLRVEVTERVAVAGVASAGAGQQGGVDLVDATGVVMATEPRLPTGLVRLEVTSPGPEDPATRAALEVFTALPEGLRGQVLAVRAQSDASVTLQLAEERTVVWGAPGGTETKAAAVEVLLGMEGTVIDVSAPGVVVRR